MTGWDDSVICRGMAWHCIRRVGIVLKFSQNMEKGQALVHIINKPDLGENDDKNEK